VVTIAKEVLVVSHQVFFFLGAIGQSNWFVAPPPPPPKKKEKEKEKTWEAPHLMNRGVE
jgi:hypothetical protein